MPTDVMKYDTLRWSVYSFNSHATLDWTNYLKNSASAAAIPIFVQLLPMQRLPPKHEMMKAVNQSKQSSASRKKFTRGLANRRYRSTCVVRYWNNKNKADLIE